MLFVKKMAEVYGQREQFTFVSKDGYKGNILQLFVKASRS